MCAGAAGPRVRAQVPHMVDFVAASFVQSAADVLFIRKTLDADPRGKDIKIISKIENQEGLDKASERARTLRRAPPRGSVACGSVGLHRRVLGLLIEVRRVRVVCVV
jgi:hypothetical protein